MSKLMRRLRQAAEDPSQEGPVLKILKRLSLIPMTLETLQATGIGKQVNGLRKWEGLVGETARQLVKKWKQLIPEVGGSGEGDSPQKRAKPERIREAPSGDCSDRLTDTVEARSLERHRKHGSHKPERSHHARDVATGGSVEYDPNAEKSEHLRPSESSQSGAGSTRHHHRHRSSRSLHRHEGSSARSQSQPTTSSSAEVTHTGRVSHGDGRHQASRNSGSAVDPRDLSSEERGHSLSPSAQPRDSSGPLLGGCTTSSGPDEPVVPTAMVHGTPKKRKANLGSASDAVAFSKRSRTQVYSGKKTTTGPQVVPSLFDISMRILLDNIDAIEEVGGVPYMIMEPVLQKCTPTQLMRLEEFNPHFLEDSDLLWEKHCLKEFRGAGCRNGQTWRELYIDKLTEREEKLKSLSASIKARKAAREEPLRQAKLATAARVPSRRGGPRAPPIPARLSLMNRSAFNRALEKPGAAGMSPLMRQTVKMAKERKLMMAAKPGKR